MTHEQKEYLLNLLSDAENWVNLYFNEGLEKNNALTKLAEAVFWCNYYFDLESDRDGN